MRIDSALKADHSTRTVSQMLCTRLMRARRVSRLSSIFSTVSKRSRQWWRLPVRGVATAEIRDWPTEAEEQMEPICLTQGQLPKLLSTETV